MIDTNSFDLLTRRKKGWKPEAVLVVTPYVEDEFFRRLARDLRPKRLHVVIDDGCRREDLTTVRSAIAAGGYKREAAIKLGSARGLVHIKLYYVRWRTPAGHKAHSLVFGSANASRQGFSGEHNAELVADAKLTGSGHANIIAWCDEMIAATEAKTEERIEAAHDVVLSKDIRLRLPAITVGRKVSAVSNFDLWIQRGWLLSSYRPDPSFLRVVLPLARPLPPGDQARQAANAGFDVAQTKSVRHSYIHDGPDDSDDADEGGGADPGNWRRKLFTWTHLGEWCSEECEETHREDFRRRHHEHRTAAIVQLEGLKAAGPRRIRETEFLDKMHALWTAFGEEAGTILKGGAALDSDHYAALFDDRVERDLTAIADREFRARYISGFELVSVPRFRNDVAGWRDFVASLVRQLALDDQRERTQSRLLMAVRHAADISTSPSGLPQDTATTLDFLRDIFEREDKTAREMTRTLRRYHRL